MLSLSLKEVLVQMKNGQISSAELCKKCVQRAKHLKELNMFITISYPDHRRSVPGTDTSTRHETKSSKTLEGIPFAIKDNFSTQGIRTTCASAMLQNYIPPYNATVVQKLLDQGATIIGKTNMDEFAMGAGSIDGYFGPVRNPWNYKFFQRHDSNTNQSQKRTNVKIKRTGDPNSTRLLSQNFHSASEQKNCSSPLSKGSSVHNARYQSWMDGSDWLIAGGSSGGSAVAVATGVSFGALSSDTGGSTRNPASYCGVVGLKPTYGRLSRHGLIPLANSMDVPGILARKVEDAAIIFNTLSGHDVKDSTTVTDPFHTVSLPEVPSVKGITVGIPQEYHIPGTEEDVITQWTKVADMFEKAGARVIPVSLPYTAYSGSCYSVLCCCEVASNMARYDGIKFGHRAQTMESTEQLYAATRHDGFNDVVRGRILAGNYFLLKSNYDRYVLQAMKLRRLITEDFKKVFSNGVDVLLTPTTVGEAPSYKSFAELDNRTRTDEQDVYTIGVNLAGLPAIVVPSGLSSNGLPIGLQLIGKNFQEQELLTVAKWLEQEVSFPYLDLSFLDSYT